MTRMNARFPVLPLFACALAVALALIGSMDARPVPPASAELAQAPACEWRTGPRLSQSLYSMASAYDFDEDVMYLFGGLNKDLGVQSFMQAIDFAGAADPSAGAVSTKRAGTARLFGASAFYRPDPEGDDKGTVYVLFGSKDPGAPSGSGTAGGAGENTVYAYDIETNAWRVVTASGIALGERLFAAAEYDRANDVAVVTGGVKRCSIAEVLAGSPCVADAFETLILRFDDAGNVTAERGPTGGPRTVYGHTMDYDPMAGRMLVHGGTTNGTAALDATWALDMGDLSALAWRRIGTGGPAVIGHTAAYWAGQEWLVVHGGASNAPTTPRENVNTRTHGLDFGAGPAPAWADLGATTSPTERMGASAEFVDAGAWQAVVVAGGRTRFDERTSSVAANTNFLVCESGTGPGSTETPDLATPSATAVGPTPSPTFTPEIPIVTPTPTPPPPAPDAKSCPRLDMRVPRAVIDAALANPARINGWGQRCWHHLKASPFNPLREYLDIVNPNKPYDPLYNPVIFKCGCL